MIGEKYFKVIFSTNIIDKKLSKAPNTYENIEGRKM